MKKSIASAQLKWWKNDEQLCSLCYKVTNIILLHLL